MADVATLQFHVLDLRPGDEVHYPTAANGVFIVKWQRDGVVMTTTDWLLDLRNHHEPGVRYGHVRVTHSDGSAPHVQP